MGAIQDIKKTYLTLSVAERKQLIRELIDTIDQEPSLAAKEKFVITDEMRTKHPILKLAGIWTEEEGDAIMKTIKEGDWIDDGSYD